MTDTGQEIVRQQEANALMTMDEIFRMSKMAEAMAKSGFFQDSQSVARAFTKMLIGRDLGLSTAASMTGIHFVKGNIMIGSNVEATKLRQWRGPEGQRYTYRILTPDADRDTQCTVEFRFKDSPDAEWEIVGTETFNEEMAKKAGVYENGRKDGRVGTGMYEKFGRNMYYARCMSNGVASHAPEVMESVRAYTEADFDVDAVAEEVHRQPGDLDRRAERMSEPDVDPLITDADVVKEPDPTVPVPNDEEMAAADAALGVEPVDAEPVDPDVEQSAAHLQNLKDLAMRRLAEAGEEESIIGARLRGARDNPNLLKGLVGYAEKRISEQRAAAERAAKKESK